MKKVCKDAHSWEPISAQKMVKLCKQSSLNKCWIIKRTEHTSVYLRALFHHLPLKRSVTGLVVMGTVMAEVELMVQEAEMKSGDGEEQGGGLKQRSSGLRGLLLSTPVKSKRSRPEEAVALVLLSEGAKGSYGWRKWGGGDMESDGRDMTLLHNRWCEDEFTKEARMTRRKRREWAAIPAPLWWKAKTSHRGKGTDPRRSQNIQNKKPRQLLRDTFHQQISRGFVFHHHSNNNSTILMPA